MTNVKFTVPVTFIGRTVTGRDSYGNDVYGDAPVATEGVFAPGGSSENTQQGGDTVVTQPTVFLPDLDVTPVDRIVIDGVTWQVDGTPRNWPANAFTGWRPDYPLEVPLRRVTG